MSFDVDRPECLVVVTVVEIDRSTVQAFADELNAAVQQYREQVLRDGRPPRALVIDFSAVRFLDSSGIRVLVDADLALGLDGGRLHLRDATGIARRALEVAGLWERLTQFGPDVTEPG